MGMLRIRRGGWPAWMTAVGLLLGAATGGAQSTPFGETKSTEVDASNPAGAAGSLPVVQTATHEVAATASRWMAQAQEFLQTQGLKLAVNLCAAIVVFMVGRWGARLAARLVQSLMVRARVDEMLVRFLTNVFYTLLLAVVGLASLELLGVNVTSLTAMIAAVGFAIGMALQGSLGNFASGVMLIVLKPFRVGDSIVGGGESGTVEEINVFSTVLRTADNVRVIVPNGQIAGGTITNFTAEPIRRIELKVTCGYGDDLLAVKRFLEKAALEDPRVQDTPAPAVSVDHLADFGVQLTVTAWAATSDHGSVRSGLLERIKLGFDEQGFTIPFPSRDVYMHQAA